MTNKCLKLLPLLALIACAEPRDNPENPAYLLGLPSLHEILRPESKLVFPRFQSGSGPIVREVSFFAKVGTQRDVAMQYANGDVFLRFTVGPLSLLRQPNGELFLPGDSIQITVALDATDRMIAHFEPSGLVFNPLLPARLEMFYQGADPDLNSDGDVDAADAALESSLKVWKQEALGLPWLRLPSVNILGVTVGAGVQSFTSFAVASS
jgi:hypothetical protein